jgi:isoleucyl-tRNA synthetase
VRRYPYVHSYPHCWRCRTPLIYWGKPSWYIATSTRKDDLLAQNATIDWHPAHIREGRFGEWLSNNVDWALSRDRYWGTPLPIWRCGRGHLQCIASLAELSELCGRDVTGIDPHRPVIDDVVFDCPVCAEAGQRDEDAVSRRVAPVIDAWFDSGAMPAAQVGYPHAPGSVDAFTFPADFISEAIDQTRGWFYSLLAINTLVFGESPYKHVVCLGHIIDAEGRKMSKSLGNIIDPWTILDTRGADALRWWMFSQGSPWTPTRASLAAIDTALRDMLLKLWNTFSFFTTYASLNDFDPADPEVHREGPGRARPLDPFPAGQHPPHRHRRAGGLRAARRRVGSGQPGRRSLQLVRAPEPAPVLAHRSRCPCRGHAGRPGHAARSPEHRVAPAGTVLPVRGRRHVARPERGRRDTIRAPGRLARRR